MLPRPERFSCIQCNPSECEQYKDVNPNSLNDCMHAIKCYASTIREKNGKVTNARGCIRSSHQAHLMCNNDIGAESEYRVECCDKAICNVLDYPSLPSEIPSPKFEYWVCVWVSIPCIMLVVILSFAYGWKLREQHKHTCGSHASSVANRAPLNRRAYVLYQNRPAPPAPPAPPRLPGPPDVLPEGAANNGINVPDNDAAHIVLEADVNRPADDQLQQPGPPIDEDLPWQPLQPNLATTRSNLNVTSAASKSVPAGSGSVEVVSDKESTV